MNYNGKRFRPVVNSAEGQVNGETLFEYEQEGDVLRARYAGGGIRCGQMLGLVTAEGELEFAYQHLTDAGELRAGHCHSVPEILTDGRIRLHEEWQWTLGATARGASVVEEVGDGA